MQRYAFFSKQPNFVMRFFLQQVFHQPTSLVRYKVNTLKTPFGVTDNKGHNLTIYAAKL